MFNTGDLVVVTMSTNSIFEWMAGGTSFQAVIVHIPQDVGDMWHFAVGKISVAINPASGSLVGITKGVL
jgi:hypothetical protein